MRKSITIKSIALASIVLIVLIGFKLHQNYHNSIIEYSNLIFPSKNTKHLEIEPNKTYLEKDGKDSNAILFSKKPGETIESTVVIKNPTSEDLTVVVEPFEIFQYTDDTYEEKVSEEKVDSIVSFEEPKQKLRAGELRHFKYKVELSESFAPDTYIKGLLRTRPVKDVDQPKGTLGVVISAGIPLYVDLSENPEEYKSIKEIQSPQDLALAKAFLEIRWIAAILFATISLYFLFRSFFKKK